MSSESPENDPLRSLRDLVDELAQRLGAIEARLEKLETPQTETLREKSVQAGQTKEEPAPDYELAKKSPEPPVDPRQDVPAVTPPESPPEDQPTDSFLIAEVVEPSEPQSSETRAKPTPPAPVGPTEPAEPTSLSDLSKKRQQERKKEQAKGREFKPPVKKRTPTSPSTPAAPTRETVPGQTPRKATPTQAASKSLFEQDFAVKIRDRLAMLLPAKDESWETWLGSRGLAIMGSIVIILAIAFAVPVAWKYFETPDWVKVLGFHLLGVGFLAGGHFLNQKKFKLLSNCLAGLGIFSLYAIAFGALHLYEIWGERVAFAECAAITLLAIIISIRANSVTIVLLGALGGYLTPIITSSGSGDYVGWFAYLAFLNVALIGCAVIKGWSFLKPIAWAATALMFWLWTHDANHFTPFLETKLWPTQWLLTLHAAIFLLGSTIPPILWRRRSTQIDLSALVSSSLWFLAMTAFLFHNQTEQQLALVSWGLAILHGVLFAITYSRVGNVDRMPRVQLALSAIFFTLAVPLQLNDWAYLSAAWCVEGLIFAIVSVYFRDRQMAISALIVFVLAGGRMLYDYLFHDPHFVEGTEIDSQFLIISCSAILAMTAGLVFRFLPGLLPREGVSDRFEHASGALLIAVGNLVLLASMTCQWSDRTVLLLWTLDAAIFWALGWVVLRRAQKNTDQTTSSTQSENLSSDPSLLFVYGAMLALLVAGGRAIYHFDKLQDSASLILNLRFGSLAFLAAVYLVFGWLSRNLWATSDQTLGQNRTNESKFQQAGLHTILAILGNFVLFTACCFEIHSYFENLSAGANFLAHRPADSRTQEMLAYSVLAAQYGVILFILGAAVRYFVYRAIAICGLFALLIKILLVDLQLTPATLGDSDIDFRFAVSLFALAIASLPSLWLCIRKTNQGDLEQTGDKAWTSVERNAAALTLAVANVVAMFALTCQWDSRIVLVIWTLDAAAILLLGFRLRISEIRSYAAGLALLLVGGRALSHTNEVADNFQLILNDRFLSLGLVALLYFVAAWLYRRLAAAPSDNDQNKPKQSEQLLDPVFALLGSLVLLSSFTMEIHSWFATATAAQRTPFPDMQMAEQATYSIVWAIYAALMVTAGFLFRYRLFRILGLLGFLVVLAKVFFIDLAHLSLLPRVLALAFLGVMMLVASFLYFRFTGRVDQQEESSG